MEKETAIKLQFNRAAEAYSTSAIFAKGQDLTLMVETAKPTAEMRVLDVGCAAGHTAFAFAPYVREVIGVDLSEGTLKEATKQARDKNFNHVNFQLASANNLPFADNDFDIVTCRYVAHHFPDLGPALGEIFRVLKPGGVFLLVDIISPEDSALADWINQIEILRDPSHSRDWMLSEWQGAGARVGMPLTVISRWDLPIDFVDWTARQQTPQEAIVEIENLLDSASPAAQSAFSIVGPPQRGFHLWSVLLKGNK